MQDVFQLDALESSKAITNTVTNPDYDAYFGRIAYGKGGCLLRMAQNFMTEDKFRKGVSKYLKMYQYANAETKDLWDALNSEAGDLPKDLASIMDTWTKKPGYPVVSYDGTNLEQTRFLLNATGKKIVIFKYKQNKGCGLAKK